MLEVLKDIGPDASQAAPEIAGALTDKNAAVQAMALMAFETIGPAAKVAIPQLREAAKPGTRPGSSPAGYRCSLPGRSRQPRDDRSNCQCDARRRLFGIRSFGDLGRLGPKAKSAMPALEDALKDKDPAVRDATAEAIRKIDFERGEKYYEDTIKREPKNSNALRNLALLFAACPDAKIRDAKKAVENGTKACELTGWKTPSCLAALAAAYAEAGDFDAAARYEQKSIEISLATSGDQDPGRARSSFIAFNFIKPTSPSAKEGKGPFFSGVRRLGPHPPNKCR